MASRLAEEVARRLNDVLPQGVRVHVPPATSNFAIYSGDDYCGTQGLGLNSATRSPAEVAEQLEVALGGIQDAVVHAVNGAWPDLGAGGLPECWAAVADDELRFGVRASGRLAADPARPVTAGGVVAETGVGRVGCASVQQ